jgi:hypothetical protein
MGKTDFDFVKKLIYWVLENLVLGPDSLLLSELLTRNKERWFQ